MPPSLMVKKQGYRAFTDQQIRAIKLDMIAGVSCGVLARAWKCSEGTMSRIRRGLTYGHVHVPGEECLRPDVIPVPMGDTAIRTLTGMTEDEEEERAAESFAELQRQLGLSPEVAVERTLEGEGS